jgi:hypothetical protein
MLDRTTPCLPTLDSSESVGSWEVRWTGAEGRRAMLAVWEALEREAGAFPLMASREWVECWLKYYGDLVPHRFVTVRGDDRYVGIALVTRGLESTLHRWTDRSWHVGTAGEPEEDSVCVEYNTWACLSACRDHFLRELIAAVQREPAWDSLRFDGFAEYDLPDWLLDDPAWTCERKPARWVDLDDVRRSGQDLIQSFGDSTRKGIRQNLKKMGQVRFEWAETVDHAHDIFTDLITLHQARWNAVGKPGCYASERFTAFHRELITRMVPQGKMLLARVSGADHPVGCSQLLVDRGRALVYQGGRLADESGSPGLVTDFLAMQECLARGYSAYDFMAGDSMHKRRLTTCETPLVWATWRRPTWARQVLDGLKSAKRLCRGLLGHGPLRTPTARGTEEGA